MNVLKTTTNRETTMMRFLQRSISYGVITLFITACATTQLTSSWKDPSYTRQPFKVMVIGVAKRPVIKRAFEDEFVKQLNARGVDAIASYTVMPDSTQNNPAVIAAKMKENGADSVLISRLVNKTVQTYVPGSVYYPPSNYNNWRDYYGYGYEAIYTPGYVAEDEYALMEINLYDAQNDKLIWSAKSQTVLMGDNQDQIKSSIGVMVSDMVEQKLLR